MVYTILRKWRPIRKLSKLVAATCSRYEKRIRSSQKDFGDRTDVDGRSRIGLKDGTDVQKLHRLSADLVSRACARARVPTKSADY